MINLEDLYFDWLLARLDPDGVSEGVAYLCDLLHDCEFQRRVGNDINRAVDGANLRKEFFSDYDQANFDPHITNHLMMMECTWFEMLVALSRSLDFLYDGGVEGVFMELITNLKLDFMTHFGHVALQEDQYIVEHAVGDVDSDRFDKDGHGGIFPLSKPNHPDQRRIEIWDQQAAYFNEKLEGVLWISTT